MAYSGPDSNKSQFFITLASVSYTHLDVYKRQLLLLSERLCSILFIFAKCNLYDFYCMKISDTFDLRCGLNILNFII